MPGDPMGFELIRAHEPEDDDERRSRARMLLFLMEEGDLLSRENRAGHFTASGFVVRPDGAVLLVHHKRLSRWLQPGGHFEPGDASISAAALREVREETGISELRVGLGCRPLDLDVHEFPERSGFPAHPHHDVRFLFQVGSGALAKAGAGESTDLRWFTEQESDSLELDPGMRRALAKARRVQSAA